MKFDYSSKIDDGILNIRTSGKGPSLDEVKEFSKNTFQFCLKNNCTKILADDRDQEYSLTDVELFELGEYHAAHMPVIIKLAVVSAPEYVGKIKLWENTAYNRGRNVKIFLDIELAKKWLMEE